MADLTFLVPAPASQEEYKPFDVTVRLTYEWPDDIFTEGTFIANLKYGSDTVWSDSIDVDGIIPSPAPQNLDQDIVIGTRYFYSGAELEVIFTYTGGSESVSQSLDITADVTSPTVVSSSGSVG